MQVRVDRECLRVVVALRQADRVATGRVPVLLPVIELVLLLVEAVHDVACAAAGKIARARRQAVRREHTRLRTCASVRRDVRLDRERGVREVTRDPVGRIVAGHRKRRRRRQVDVVLEQTSVRRSVLGNLGCVRRIGVRAPVDPLPAPVQVVEAVVLLVDDDDVIDLVELLPIVVARRSASGHRRDGKRCASKRNEDCELPHHLDLLPPELWRRCFQIFACPAEPFPAPLPLRYWNDSHFSAKGRRFLRSSRRRRE